MSVEDLARQIGNLADLKVVPKSTNTLELNMPVKIDGLTTFAGGTANTNVQNGLTALSGGGQAGATQLNNGQNRVTTVAALHDSCVLPAATAGVNVTAMNEGANGMDVYPLGASDVIQGIAAQTSMLVAAGSSVEFRCVVAGTWNLVSNNLLEASWSTNTTTTTFAAGQLTGGGFVVYTSTATTPGSIATRTATQMFNDTPNAQVGATYILLVYNQSGSANTLTITAGSGVTLTGTATIAQNIGRFYFVTFTSATALVMQEMFAITLAA